MDIVFVFIFGVLIFGLLLLAFISRGGSRKKHNLTSGQIQYKWNSLQGARVSKNIASLKSAVITADKLVDHALKSIGSKGNTMAERIKNSKNALGDKYDKVWDAHRTRNRMVHEIDTEVRFHEAQKALDLYEEILKQLGVVN